MVLSYTYKRIRITREIQQFLLMLMFPSPPSIISHKILNGTLMPNDIQLCHLTLLVHSMWAAEYLHFCSQKGPKLIGSSYISFNSLTVQTV